MSTNDVASLVCHHPGHAVVHAATLTVGEAVIIINLTPYMDGRATTWGVFKGYAFFYI